MYGLFKIDSDYLIHTAWVYKSDKIFFLNYESEWPYKKASARAEKKERILQLSTKHIVLEYSFHFI